MSREKPRNQCFGCRSRRCHVRIWTDEGDFDEVSCSEHILGLEQHADWMLERRMRHHLYSTDNLRRATKLVRH